MINSFQYKIWFDIKPVRTSNGELEMEHGEIYEVEKILVRNGFDVLYKIKGKFKGEHTWRTNSLIVPERIYKLIETYANEPEFIRIR